MAKIATVASVTGKAFAVSADGKVRPLKVGDVIEKDEVIQTAAGAHVELQMVDGQSLAVAPEQNIKIDESLVHAEQQPTSQEATVTPGTADAVIQALERGGDLNQELEATAAGLGGGGGGQGNAGFVRLLRVSEGIDPLAYQYTPPEFGPIQTIEGPAILATEPPTVSVGVTVGTQIGTGEGGPGLITGNVVKSAVSAIDVLEGSSGGGKAVTFLITLDKAATTNVTITYTIVPGSATDTAHASATNPADYYDGAVTGTVTIPAGYTGFTVTENIVGDIRVENNETFKIVLSNPIGATLVNDTATVTIVDDDHAPVAKNDAASMTEDDTKVTGNVLTNDSDQDGQTLSVANGPVTVVNSYGTLVIGADGHYEFTPNAATHEAIQALAKGESMAITFTGAYQATDGANLSNLADLKITVNGLNDKPVITTTAGQDAGTVVEAGNADAGTAIAGTTSTDPGAVVPGTPTATGTLSSSDVDHGATATWSGNANGTYGTFAITNAGVWTYTLDNAKANSLAEGESKTETFTATVTDDQGATATETVTITVTGSNDSPVISFATGADAGGVKEDTTLTSSGQLSSSDVDHGATATWSINGSSTGTYGAIAVDAAGKWTYTLANNAAVQALAEGETKTETYTVRVTDDKGAWDDQQVTVTITGTNDKPVITTNSGNPGNAHDVVNEAGLPNGSSHGDGSNIATGTFTVSDVDGLNTLQSVTIGGNTVLMGNLVGHDFIGAHGTLHIDSYNSATGEAGYTYTLTSTLSSGAVQGTNTVLNGETFTLTTSDGIVSSDPASIIIDVKDDVPSISTDNLAITNNAGTYTGNYHFGVGADTQPFASSFGSGSLQWTNASGGYTLQYDAAHSTSTTEMYTAVNGSNTFFTIAVNSDGTYNFNLVTPEPVTTSPQTNILSGISGGSNLTSYSIDSSTFGGYFSLLLTGTEGGSPKGIWISATDLGVGDDVMQGNKGDVLKFDVQPVAGMDATLHDLTINMATTGGIKTTDSVTMTIHYTDGSNVTQSQQIGSDYAVTYSFNSAKTVDYVTLAPASDDVSFKITGVSLSYDHPVFPNNYELDFKLTGADADLDTASANFAVAVNTTSTSTYTIYDTAGNDSIYGTSGSDTFAWRLNEAGSDTVKNFHINGLNSATDNDALNLKDLLTGEHANSGSLDAYLDFGANASGQAVVSVHAAGAGQPVTQTITLENITYAQLQTFAGGTGSDVDIINKLLAHGNLKTDV